MGEGAGGGGPFDKLRVPRSAGSNHPPSPSSPPTHGRGGFGKIFRRKLDKFSDFLV